MNKAKQELNIEILGEKIESVVKRNAFKELIVIESKDFKDVLHVVYLIRKEFGHLINSIWINESFISLRITEAGQISWCEIIDRRPNKQ